MKKKISNILILFLVMATSPLLADFCHKCGKNMPQDANFCPSCGTAVAGAFTSAPENSNISNSNSTNISNVSTGTTNKNADDSALTDYSFINDIEHLLTQSSYTAASRQASLIRSQNAAKITRLEANYLSFSPYRRKIHDLYMLKLRYIDEYIDAWKKGENNGDIAQSKAYRNKAAFCMNKIDEAIDEMYSSGATLTSISKAEEIEDRMKRTTATYIVTSPYLLVNNQRLNRGEPIWIIDVNGASAKIMHLGAGRSSEPIFGWVSVYDLEKRSNWRSDPIFYYSAPLSSSVIYTNPPARTESSVVFVFDDPFWHWHHRHYPRHHHPAPPPPPRHDPPSRRGPDRNPPPAPPKRH